MIAPAAIVGAGAWGTALANVLAHGGRPVTLIARDPAHAAAMQRDRQNQKRLPGVALAPTVQPAAFGGDLGDCRLVVLAVPTQTLRGVARDLAAALHPDAVLVITAKGIERDTGAFVSAIVDQALPGHTSAVLSGPSFASDVARGLPTAVTLATAEAKQASALADALASPTFRLYHTTDVRGVELGGAVKNVLAIACGLAAGRALGASGGAALVARGFAEMARLGVAFGARPETLTGLSGLGDLVLTATSGQSRNYALGFDLGRGLSPKGDLAEGAFTAEILVRLARQHSVELPICASVADVLAGRLEVAGATERLLARPQRAEGWTL